MVQLSTTYTDSEHHSAQRHVTDERTNRRQYDANSRSAKNEQESLANAKLSARQPWYIGRNSLNRPPLRIAQQYQRNLHR